MSNISGVVNPSEIYRANVAAQRGEQVQQNNPLGVSFGDIFNGLVSEADQLYNVADAGTKSLLAGETDNIAQVMIDSAKAETSLNMVIQIRNKVLDAYNEVMRMSL